MKNWRVIFLATTFVGLAAATSVIWYVISADAREPVLTVAFLDVGQGDAVLIESPSGMQVLIDGGPNKQVLRELGSIMPFWDRSIDMLVATHPDLDHIGGLPSVISRFDVLYYMKSGVGADTSVYDALEARVASENAETVLARRGDVVDLGAGVFLYILFPDRDTEDFDPNLASIVAKLEYGATSFLLTGDSPKSIEKYIASVDGDFLDVDVLKLGHHGSKTSTSEELLGFTSPDFAIISAGADNRYGHPHKEVLARLEQFDIEYLETALHGTIVFESDGENISLK